jgi:peptidoglycan/xylan/chitin deacetylase (PgdA/CDA1 family)
MNRIIALVLFLCIAGYEASFADNKVKSSKIFVLCFHTFHSANKGQYNFSPSVFSEQIQTIKKLGYHFLSMQDFIANKFDYPLNVMITIDDGNRTIDDIYTSILKKFNVPVTFFIYPNIIGKMNYALNFKELDWYKNDGVYFGGHGFYHEFVNQKLYDISVQRFKDEIYKAKDVLEKKLSMPIITYAYPFGVYSPITIEHLKLAGYKYAFTIEWGYIETPVDPQKFYKLPRYLVTTTSWKSIYDVLKKHAGEMN